MKKVWMYDPHSGGAKITPQTQKIVTQRIQQHAQQQYAGKFTRINLRFKAQFCYIDAYTEPYIHEPHNEELFGPKEEYVERLRNTPTHLVSIVDPEIRTIV